MSSTRGLRAARRRMAAVSVAVIATTAPVAANAGAVKVAAAMNQQPTNHRPIAAKAKANQTSPTPHAAAMANARAATVVNAVAATVDAVNAVAATAVVAATAMMRHALKLPLVMLAQHPQTKTAPVKQPSPPKVPRA